MATLNNIYNIGWYGTCDNTPCGSYSLDPTLNNNTRIEAVYRVHSTGSTDNGYETCVPDQFGQGVNAFDSLDCGNVYIIRLKQPVQSIEIPDFVTSFNDIPAGTYITGDCSSVVAAGGVSKYDFVGEFLNVDSVTNVSPIVWSWTNPSSADNSVVVEYKVTDTLGAEEIFLPNDVPGGTLSKNVGSQGDYTMEITWTKGADQITLGKTITYDSVAPVTPSNLTQVGTTTTNPPTWTWDPVADADTYQVQLDTDPVVTQTDTSFTPDSPLSEGSHTLTVKAVDEAGNESVETTDNFDIDTTAPVAPVFDPVTSPTTVDPVWSWSDPLANEPAGTSVTYELTKPDGSTQDVTADINTSTTYTVADSEPGTYEMKITVTDEAGNETVVTQQIVVEVPQVDTGELADVTDPVINSLLGDYGNDSLAMNAVGSRFSTGDKNGSNTGVVNVFGRYGNNSEFEQEVSDTAPGGAFANRHNLNAAGDIMVVGAPNADPAGSTNAGFARVYKLQGGNWVQLGDDIVGDQNGYNGQDVGINNAGDIIVVSEYEYPGTPQSGRVRAYKWENDQWNQLGSDMLPPDPDPMFYGYSAAIDGTGTRVAVGQPHRDVSGWDGDTGYVYVYEFVNGDWQLLGNRIEGIEHVNQKNQTGKLVELSNDGNHVLITAPEHYNESNQKSGNVTVYQWDSATQDWVLKGSEIHPAVRNPVAIGTGFQQTVDINANGTRIAIGETYYDGYGEGGRVLVYDWDGTDWIQQHVLTVDGAHELGRCVKLSHSGKLLVTTDSVLGVHEIQLPPAAGAVTQPVITPTPTAVSQTTSTDECINTYGQIGNEDYAIGDYNPPKAHAFWINRAGDGNVPSNYWFAYNTETNQYVTSGGWIGQSFPSPVRIGDYEVQLMSGNYGGNVRQQDPKGWTFEASNDNFETFDILDTYTFPSDATYRQAAQSYSNDINNTKSYLQYRVNFQENHGHDLYLGIAGIFLYGCYTDAQIPDPAPTPTPTSTDTIAIPPYYKISGEFISDMFGGSVSINSDANRLFVGAYKNSESASEAGHVRVYRPIGTSWEQLGSDVDGGLSDKFGFSIDSNDTGTRFVAGGFGGPERVRVFALSGNNEATYGWSQVGTDIIDNTPNKIDAHGYSVAMNSVGDRVAIGAIYDGSALSNAGSTTIYQMSNGDWVQLGSIIYGEAASDYSGISLGMNSDGTRVAIGGYYNDGGGNKSGHVRVYEWKDNDWSQLGGDIDGIAPDELSGQVVDLNATGDVVIIGASGKNANTGCARVYILSNNTWVQLGDDIDGTATGDAAGRTVSINAVGNRVAVGIPGNDDGGSNAGQVKVYDWTGTEWLVNNDDVFVGDTAGDRLGSSVCLNNAGDYIAIGADNFNMSRKGYVIVNQLTTAIPTIIPAGPPAPTPTPTAVTSDACTSSYDYDMSAPLTSDRWNWYSDADNGGATSISPASAIGIELRDLLGTYQDYWVSYADMYNGRPRYTGTGQPNDGIQEIELRFAGNVCGWQLIIRDTSYTSSWTHSLSSECGEMWPWDATWPVYSDPDPRTPYEAGCSDASFWPLPVAENEKWRYWYEFDGGESGQHQHQVNMIPVDPMNM